MLAPQPATPVDAHRAPVFTVAYSGSGRWHTVDGSEPANPGGAPDHNHADDSSTQRWALRWRRALRIGRPGLVRLTKARGNTGATGRIDHHHVDGLYRFDDASEACTVQASTAAGAQLSASVVVRHRPRSRSVRVTALVPVSDVLLGQCPGQGDSLDGLADNYFTPGFSYASGYGPERWFRSRTVTVALAAFARSRKVVVRLGQTRAGTPPRHCAVASPSTEQCTADGAWSGRLTFTRRFSGR